MKFEEFYEKIKSKVQDSEEDLKKEYDELLANEKDIHSSLTEEAQQDRALRRLQMSLKRQLKSPAVTFEGRVVGVGDLIDTMIKKRAEALSKFRENPDQAVEDKVTNTDGVPLDLIETFKTGKKNFNFGKPMKEHSWMRTVIAKVSKKGEGKPKTAIITLNDDVAKQDIPLFKPVSFKALDKSMEGSDTYQLNGSTLTKFKVDETLEIPEISKILDAFQKIELNQLTEWHNKHQGNYNIITKIEGDVSMLRLEPTATGSRMMVLEDGENLDDLESEGTVVWIPKNLDIDFAEQSRVVVLGRTGLGKKRNEDGSFSQEPGNATMNAYGIFAIPEFKISVETKEVTQENSEPKQEDW